MSRWQLQEAKQQFSHHRRPRARRLRRSIVTRSGKEVTRWSWGSEGTASYEPGGSGKDFRSSAEGPLVDDLPI